MPASLAKVLGARRAFAAVLGGFFLLSLPCPAKQGIIASPQAGGVQPTEPRFRAARSISGSKGSQQGSRYVIEDPRTVFYVPDDRQVIVYFEWEGPVGRHHFEGLWKSPEGKAVVISDFDYEAKDKRFAGYWTLALGESAASGLWALEARVDGEVAGIHTFQIIAAPKPANTAASRRLPSASEIYQSASAASVFIQKLDARGEQAGGGSGFFIGDGFVLTAFQVIDGASALRVLLPNGQHADGNQVVAWNRRQDWAIFKIDTGKTPVLERAQHNPWSVGDRCYTLDSPTVGSRVIVAADVTGKSSLPGAGERINISMPVSLAGIGSPLLNEYGEVFGLMGGRLIAGASWLEASGIGYTEILSANAPLREGLAVPISLIPAPAKDAKLTPLEELHRSGEFVPLITARENVLFGALAKSVDRKGAVPRPVEQRASFSHRDTTLSVFVSWEPLAKIKGKNKTKTTTAIRVYDMDNRLRVESNPAKMDLRANQPTYTISDVPLANLAPGVYRLDVLLGDDTAWRTFFRVVE